MNKWSIAIVASVAIGGFALLIVQVFDDPQPTAPSLTSAPEDRPDPRIDQLAATVAQLARETSALRSRPVADGDRISATDNLDDELAQRFEALETELRELRATIENLVPATEASEDRFTDDAGSEIADQYFDDGKFATAASGYLKFLEHHPQHPNAIAIRS
jgi:hypothetical protein